MAKKKVKVNLGDIFAIKVNENTYSYGQIVTQGETDDSMIIYDITSEKHPALEEIISKPIIFFINTMDMCIQNGNWVIIGNAKVPTDLKFPSYIVGTPSGYKVVSHNDKILGKANKSAIRDLKFFTSYSPVCLEDTIKSKYDNGEWYKELDDILYKIPDTNIHYCGPDSKWLRLTIKIVLVVVIITVVAVLFLLLR